MIFSKILKISDIFDVIDIYPVFIFLQDICYKSDKIALITLLLYNYSTTLSKRKIYGALEINKVIKLPITLEFAATLQISNSKIPNYFKLQITCNKYQLTHHGKYAEKTCILIAS